MEISHIIFKQTHKNETLYPLELYFLLHADKRIRFFLYVYLYALHHIQGTNQPSIRKKANHIT